MNEKPHTYLGNYLSIYLQVVFPTAIEATVYITHPTPLKWTKENHMKRFPKMYKESVITVLKCHHRWQNMDPDLAMIALSEKEEESRYQEKRSGEGEGREEGGEEEREGEGTRRDCWNSPAAQDQYEDVTSTTTFGDIPKDIVLDILSLAAPYVPDIVPLSQSDMEKYQRGEPLDDLS